MSLIFIIHWIGEFVCQTNWIADRKYTSKIRALHALIYCAVFAPFVFVSGIYNEILIIFALFLSHYLIDTVTAPHIKRFRTTNRYFYFNAIGLDQAMHMIALDLLLRGTFYA